MKGRGLVFICGSEQCALSVRVPAWASLQAEWDGQFSLVLRNNVEGLKKCRGSVRLVWPLWRHVFVLMGKASSDVRRITWQVMVRHWRTRLTLPMFAALLGRPLCLEYLVEFMSEDDMGRIGKGHSRTLLMCVITFP